MLLLLGGAESRDRCDASRSKSSNSLANSVLLVSSGFMLISDGGQAAVGKGDSDVLSAWGERGSFVK
jgi:hypothetical protein